LAGDVVNGHNADLVAEFICSRRQLGYRSASQDRALRAFARFLDLQGREGPVDLETTLAWATATTSADPCNAARRLATIRGYLRHLAAVDGATDVPAPSLLGPHGHRKPPHIYSDREIADLIDASRTLPPAGGLRPRCYATLFGFIACTGLRATEALMLTCGDVDLDEGVLTVRNGKRRRTRLVPLHPSAMAPLGQYAAARRRQFGRPRTGDAFFRTDRSERVSYNAANSTFCLLRRQLGWTADGRTRAPRVHDLRHRMVVRRIQAWHGDNVDVDAKLAVLATYLGHVEIRDVYWYLSAVPELMDVIAERFDGFAHPDTESAS
jgi:integrase